MVSFAEMPVEETRNHIVDLAGFGRSELYQNACGSPSHTCSSASTPARTNALCELIAELYSIPRVLVTSSVGGNCATSAGELTG